MTTITIMDDGTIDGYMDLATFAESHGQKHGTAQQMVNRGKLNVLRIGKQNFVKVGTAWPDGRRRGRKKRR